MASSIATIAINDKSQVRKDGCNRYAIDENNRTFFSAKLVMITKPGFGIRASYNCLCFSFSLFSASFSITNPGTGGKLMANQNDVKKNVVNEILK